MFFGGASPVEAEAGSVPPLRTAHADAVRWYLEALDTSVDRPHHCDGDPNISVAARLRVGMPPLLGKPADETLERCVRLFGQHPIDQSDKG